MKKYLTSALIASLFGIANANATDVKPFVGANFALTGVVWTESTKDASANVWELPTSFWGLGFDFGARFTNDNMYNCGLTLAYDYIFDSSARISSIAKPYILSVETGFSAFSLTFDNYLRVSEKDEKRSDIVLGIGMASVKERLYLLPTSVGTLNGIEKIDDYDTGGAFIFKVGYNSKINDNMDWGITGRWFITYGNSNEKDVETMFNLSFGLRYSF